ncbi:MAG: bifunctional serine/threonine-protein kinase/formylglycine-generating enzyme family protein [Phycisphaerae bacterium]|nr:bifunctional serine/threonine-protein kinase/formylglycine-generating enzyme family protein [Phycisphaerae bacterium]
MREAHDNSTGDQQLDEIIAQYLLAREAGRAPSRDEWLARYPEFAKEINAFLADEGQFRRLLGTRTQSAVAADGKLADVVGSTCSNDGVLRPGSVFQNRYEITGLKGTGGFAHVYQAYDRKVPRIVAVKLLPRHVLDRDPANRRRFEREIIATANLPHPHIVTIHDAECPKDGDGFIVMEFLAGGTFGDLVRERGPQPWESVVRHASGLCDALSLIHSHRFVHRDIKPANILFTGGDREHAKLADLGIILVPHGPADAGATTQPGTQPGTLIWMAPEQVLGHEVTAQADIYAFGATIYFMLAGRPYFEMRGALNLVQLIRSITETPAIPLESIAAGIPKALVQIIHRLLEKDPGKRPAAAAALKQQLAEIVASGSAAPRSPRIVRLRGSGVGEYEPDGVIRCAKAPRLFTLDDFRLEEAGPGDTWVWPVDGAEMIFVPAGRFQMGSNECLPAEAPEHEARTCAYLIDKYPVTNARYKKFIDTVPNYPVPRVDAEWGEAYNWDPNTRTYPPGQDDYPVIMVTHDDARAYAAWARKRLPTEAEWEKAASWDPSSGTHRRYPWGDDWDDDRANSAERAAGRAFAPFKSPGPDPAYLWFQEFRRLDPHEANSFELLTKVYEYPEGASALGVMDLAGNVHEWCEPDGPQRCYNGRRDPAVRTKDWPFVRPCRGGSWADHPFYLRTSSRYAVRSERYDRIGFRCIAYLGG